MVGKERGRKNGEKGRRIGIEKIRKNVLRRYLVIVVAMYVTHLV